MGSDGSDGLPSDGWCGWTIGEISFPKLFDRRHDVRQREALLGQVIFNARRNLGERTPPDEAQLFQHPKPLCNGLGADIAHGRAQRTEAPCALQEREDDEQRRGIAEQAQGAAHRLGRTGLKLLRLFRRRIEDTHAHSIPQAPSHLASPTPLTSNVSPITISFISEVMRRREPLVQEAEPMLTA